MPAICPSCGATVDDNKAGVSSQHCPTCGEQFPEGSLRTTITPRPAQDSHPASLDNTFVIPLSEPADEEDDATHVTQAPRIESGSTISHFRLIRVLGRGGFGEVWLAEDLKLGRRVALKLPAGNDRHPRLLHEAQTGAKLRHQHIVAVYEVGEVNGQAFIASEYVQGETLRDELQRGRPTVERVIDVMAQVARAAHYAHEQSVVHRDLKPANVMVG
ncbi:MAG: protein kinase, partial [Planctomycetaceae bacterium]|nr:protein kinase [Planctomycetaceae bacterium]